MLVALIQPGSSCNNVFVGIADISDSVGRRGILASPVDINFSNVSQRFPFVVLVRFRMLYIGTTNITIFY